MPKKMSRRQMLKSALVAAGGALAGCAPKTIIVKETVEVEKTVKETVIVEKDVDKKAQMAVELKANLVWDTFRQPGSGWNEERVTTFKDKFPNIDVEFRPLVISGQQEAYGKMYAMHAAGDLGDICAFDPSHYHFPRAIEKGIIGPMTELINSDGLDLTQWFPAFIEMQYHKGDIYGLPSWAWTGYDLFVANALHFEEEGIDLPDPEKHDVTMDQIYEWAHHFYKPGSGPGAVDRYGLNLAGGDGGLTPLTRAFGGDTLNKEGTQCMLMEEGSIEALKFYYKLAVEDKILPAAGDLTGGNQGGWAAGKLTMYHCGSLCVINANKAITDESLAKVSQILFPIREDGKIPSQLRGGTWNMNKGTKHPQACYEFIKHLAGKDGTIGFNLVGGNGALGRPDVLPVLAATNPLYEGFLGNLANGMVIHNPANGRGREYTDALSQWGAKMMDPTEVVPFEQGLQDLYDNVQKVLDMEMP